MKNKITQLSMIALHNIIISFLSYFIKFNYEWKEMCFNTNEIQPSV